MKMHFPKMKPQVVSYRKLHSLGHELNVQGQFLNEKGLDAFSTICTEVLINMLLKKEVHTI